MLVLGIGEGKQVIIDGCAEVRVLKCLTEFGRVLLGVDVGSGFSYGIYDLRDEIVIGDVGIVSLLKFNGRLLNVGIDVDRSVGVVRGIGFDLREDLECAREDSDCELEYLDYMSRYGYGLSKRERRMYARDLGNLERRLGLVSDDIDYAKSVTWGTMVDRELEIELDNADDVDLDTGSDWVEGIHYRFEESTRYDMYADEWITSVVEVPIERVEVPIERVDVGIEDDLVEEVGSEEVDNGDDFGALLAMSWSNNNYENELEEELMRLEDYELDMELYGEEVRGQSRKKASKGKKQRGGDDFDTDFGFDGRKRNKISKGKGMNGGTKRTHKVVNLVDDRYDGEDD